MVVVLGGFVRALECHKGVVCVCVMYYRRGVVCTTHGILSTAALPSMPECTHFFFSLKEDVCCVGLHV